MSQKLAFVFPGQGSQSVGMLNSFIAEQPQIVDSICQEAADVLGYDIASLIAHDSEQKLDQTIYTQPALLTAGYIAWKIWQSECSEQPVLMAGHSLGEYTALVCAGAMTFAEGLKLVTKRGELMQNAVAPGVGAMAVILGLDLNIITDICNNVGAGLRAGPVGNLGTADVLVQPANLNAPGQIVIAGMADAVELAINKAKAAGAKRAIMLPISVPSHCALMRPAAENFASHLTAVDWKKTWVPVVHNFDVVAHTNALDIINALQKQLFSPVRWIETVEYFVAQGVTEIVECGPGKVLTGLNKRIATAINSRAITESLGAGLC